MANLFHSRAALHTGHTHAARIYVKLYSFGRATTIKVMRSLVRPFATPVRLFHFFAAASFSQLNATGDFVKKRIH